MNRQKEDTWKEAKRRCRLSDDEIRMAKELGFQPRSLIKNTPSPSERWKAPVNVWVRSLYEKKIGSRRPRPEAPSTARPARPPVIEFRNAQNPWPDNPQIPDLAPYLAEGFETEMDDMGWSPGFDDTFAPPGEEDVDEENILMLRQQRLFRWAAQSIAVAMSEVPEVQKIIAFGAVARPLEMEVPRFREFRRHRIEIFHECADLDLAVWTTSLSRLEELRRAMKRGLAIVQDTPYGGVAHHQVDVHVFSADSGVCRGRLCIFRECPKAGKPECRVPGCGEDAFLQQFEQSRFDPARFESEARVVLFDRASGFLVSLPRIEAKSTFKKSPDTRDDDVPF